MNVKRRNFSRHDPTNAVNIEVDKVIGTHSDALVRAVAELNKGHTVTLTPRHRQASEKRMITSQKTSIAKGYGLGHLKFSFSDVATALGGGAAFGLGSLAIAPASAAAAGIATIIGLALSGIATKKLDKQET